MIMQRQSDGTYAEIGCIMTKNGEEISRIIDKNGNTYFSKWFTRQIAGIPPLSLNAVGKPVIGYKIHGNSVQSDTPTPENPVEVQSVGELVTEGENSGKYEIPVVSKNANGESVRTSIFLDEPLRKIGDYVDYIDFENGRIVRNIGKKVFDGTEEFLPHSSLKGWFQLPYDEVYVDQLSFCTNFSYYNKPSSLSPGQFTTINTISKTGRFVFQMLENITLNEFKNFLASEYAKGTPVTVYYPLAEPIEETAILPEIPTFSGTTIIETDTEIQPSYMEITYKSRR